MTTLQTILIIFWSTIYIIMSFFSIKDLINDDFITKNDSVNILTALWTSITVFGSIFLTYCAFK